MAEIFLWQGKPLLIDGKLAISSDCCCDYPYPYGDGCEHPCCCDCYFPTIPPVPYQDGDPNGDLGPADEHFDAVGGPDFNPAARNRWVHGDSQIVNYYYESWQTGRSFGSYTSGSEETPWVDGSHAPHDYMLGVKEFQTGPSLMPVSYCNDTIEDHFLITSNCTFTIPVCAETYELDFPNCCGNCIYEDAVITDYEVIRYTGNSSSLYEEWEKWVASYIPIDGCSTNFTAAYYKSTDGINYTYQTDVLLSLGGGSNGWTGGNTGQGAPYGDDPFDEAEAYEKCGNGEIEVNQPDKISGLTPDGYPLHIKWSGSFTVDGVRKCPYCEPKDIAQGNTYGPQLGAPWGCCDVPCAPTGALITRGSFNLGIGYGLSKLGEQPPGTPIEQYDETGCAFNGWTADLYEVFRTQIPGCRGCVDEWHWYKIEYPGSENRGFHNRTRLCLVGGTQCEPGYTPDPDWGTYDGNPPEQGEAGCAPFPPDPPEYY